MMTDDKGGGGGRRKEFKSVCAVIVPVEAARNTFSETKFGKNGDVDMKGEDQQLAVFEW